MIARDRTHHLLEDVPLYRHRFRLVGSFHAPGLAPVVDDTGAYHIDGEGRAAYSALFLETWGFYESLAAVKDAGGWMHVRPDGQAAYVDRHAWCGNFQQGRCTVRGIDGKYFHIGASGQPACQLRHLYAGDYREGIAVVRFAADGLCGHVDLAGNPIHDKRFLDLDVFHKGFARARDERGWFHVDRDGREAYGARFAAVEPFYNGQALCETINGARVIIDQAGEVVVVVRQASIAL